jgi:gas vesicle protein
LKNQSTENNLEMLDLKEQDKREANRYKILMDLYELYEKTEHKKAATIDKQSLTQALGRQSIMTSAEANSALEYLIGEHLLDSPSPYHVRISHRGKKEIESSIKYPDRDTKHFSHETIKIFIDIDQVTMSNNINNDNDLRGANIVNFANQLEGNAQQVASDFSQNINQNIDEITKLIDSLRNMAREFPEEYEEQREEVLAHLEDLQEEIATPEKRKPSRIKASARALLGIASSIAVGTDFLNTSLDLLNKVGVPIDINLPQLIQNLPK